MLKPLIIAAALALPSVAAAQDKPQDKPKAPPFMPAQLPDHIYTIAPFDHVAGEADAPHSLIVYASNMCPHCRDWFNDEWPVVKKELVETGQLRLAFRPLPTQPVQLSMVGFLMAECDKDNYFDRIEDQFARQNEIIKTAEKGGLREYYAEMAKDYGLSDEVAMNECLSNERNLGLIQAHGGRYQELGIRGVPAFVLDGKTYKGPHKAEDFVKLLGK